MWDTIDSHDLLAFMHLGDLIYHDDSSSLEKQRYLTYIRQSRPEYRRLVAGTSMYSVWDDHDYGVNDAMTYTSQYNVEDPYPGDGVVTPKTYVTGADGELEPYWRPLVLDVFKENYLNPYYGEEGNPGVYFSYSIADVDFFMLDTRYYRENPVEYDPATMLGEEQLQWLKDGLAASTATFKVIASSVPFTPGIKTGSLDVWDGYDEEREEIFSFIEDNDINGVVLLAGDRHRTDCRKILRDTGYDFIEFQSACLTNTQRISVTPAIEGTELIFGYGGDNYFGKLSFDTTLADPEVTFWVVTIDNEVLDWITVPLSELSLT